jgi:magnesium-transporting ATPase (P-type)
MSHMTMTSTPLAVAADYADALMTARKAKTLLFALLAFLMLAQLAVFFLAKYDVLKLGEPTQVTLAAGATTQPADAAATQPAAVPTVTKSFDAGQIIRYVTPLVNFAVVAFSVLLVVTVLLLVVIMLVGRLVGVSHVTSAFIWGVLLVILVVPWQTFFIPNDEYAVTGTAGVAEQPAFKWPGAQYTWPELKRDYKFPTDRENLMPAIWMWGRYAGLPALALLVLLLVQIKSGRGLKYALGEAEVHVDVTTRTDPTVM